MEGKGTFYQKSNESNASKLFWASLRKGIRRGAETDII